MRMPPHIPVSDFEKFELAVNHEYDSRSIVE